jgi:predicted ester cyclase
VISRRWLFGFAALLPIGAKAAPPPDTVPLPDGAPETIEPSAAARANVAILKAYYVAMNGGDIAKAVTFYAPNTRNHGKLVGQGGLTRVLTDLRTMFPDYHHELVEITATEDLVITRNRVSGTHTGVGHIPVEGGMLVGVAPTGRTFSVQHIHWWRFKDGLIVEHYACRDDVEMMQQLGLLPVH